ncbi:MAG: universal stress protein [Natrialbaceae archaeon]
MGRVVVPVEILAGESVAAGLIDLLAPMEVTLLGYHEVPDQTPPEQAELQFETRATDALDALAGTFADAGATPDRRLVFTQDRERTVERVAGEVDAQAVVHPGIVDQVEDLLVVLRGTHPTTKILAFVEALVADRPIDVTLQLLADPGVSADQTLDVAASRLRDAGIVVHPERVDADTSTAEVVVAARGHDAVIVGQRAATLASMIFGEDADRLSEGFPGPVLVVQTEPADDDSGDTEPAGGDQPAADE